MENCSTMHFCWWVVIWVILKSLKSCLWNFHNFQAKYVIYRYYECKKNKFGNLGFPVVFVSNSYLWYNTSNSNFKLCTLFWETLYVYIIMLILFEQKVYLLKLWDKHGIRVGTKSDLIQNLVVLMIFFLISDCTDDCTLYKIYICSSKNSEQYIKTRNLSQQLC